MDTSYNKMIWGQYGAALDMLENAIDMCPEDLWSAEAQSPFHEFWYMAYHTLFWADLFLFGSIDGFRPPEPFGLEELDPAGAFPNRKYDRAELKHYLVHCREKAQLTFAEMTEEQAAHTFDTRWGALTFPELQLYAMRHIQHHAAQLNLILRQQADQAPGWVGRAL